MKFYTKQHKYYCGIDLHARSMYVCILDSEGEVVFHKDIKNRPNELKTAIAPFLDDLVIAVECMFSWYWVSDFCEDNNITFVRPSANFSFFRFKSKNFSSIPFSLFAPDMLKKYINWCCYNILLNRICLLNRRNYPCFTDF